MVLWSHYLPTFADEEELKSAVHFALEDAKTRGKSLGICVNVKGNVPFLNGVFTDVVVNQLKSNRPVIIEGVNVTLESTSTLDKYRPYGILLAVYASPKLLDIVSGISNVEHVIVVAHRNDVDEQWLELKASRGLGEA